MISVIESTSSGATEQLGEQIGSRLRGGEVIELVSDLGGGKTTLVIGLGKGIYSHDHVASPTFTITKTYKGKKLTIQHFDFYRLSEAGIVEQELLEVLDDPATVTVIEWSDVVRDVLPEARLTIQFERVANNDETRRLTLTYSAGLAYLTEGLNTTGVKHDYPDSSD